MTKEESILRECDYCHHLNACWKRCVGCGYTLCMFCKVKLNLECPVCGGYFNEPPDF